MDNISRYFVLMCFLLFSAVAIARADYQTYDEALVAARALFQKGDYEGARKELEAGLPLVKTNEDKFSALTKIGETYARRDLYKQAREQWGKALQVPTIAVDNQAAAYLLIAESYSNENNWNAARTEFQKILDTPGIELNTEYVARLGLFTSYVNLGQPDTWDKARNEIYAIINDPQFSASNQAKAAIVFGDALSGNKRFDQARAAYQEVDNINGVPALLQLNALIKVANSYGKEGKLVESDNAYNVALTYGAKEGAKLSDGGKPAESNNLFQLILKIGRIAPPEKASIYQFIGSNDMDLKHWDDAIFNLIEAAKEPDATQLAKLTPETLQWLRRSQTGARVRLARIFIGGDRKELAQTTITELLQDPNADLTPQDRAQLKQMLKSVS